jgi:hypothetical protein
VEPYEEAVALLRRAERLFDDGTAQEKRDIVAQLTCNLRLADRKLVIQAKKTVSHLRSWRVVLRCRGHEPASFYEKSPPRVRLRSVFVGWPELCSATYGAGI